MSKITNNKTFVVQKHFHFDASIIVECVEVFELLRSLVALCFAFDFHSTLCNSIDGSALMLPLPVKNLKRRVL